MRFWLLALAIPTGCSWFSATVEVRLQAPELPAHWRQAFPELTFELPDADRPAAGLLCRGHGALRLPKQANWPVLAYPWVCGVRLPPAGALYPLDLAADGETLMLSWEHGPAAEVLQALEREGFDISLVNGERLIAEMLARSAGDPGCLDFEYLAARLASGEFQVTDIRLLPARDVVLEVPPGTWFLGSPFRPAYALDAGQPLLLPAVPQGKHRLFAVELPGGFDLFVNEREVFLLPFEGD